MSSDFGATVNFIWSVANEVLRDDIKRGKYPDVILPFTVLRRLDCVLAPTKQKVLERHELLKSKGLTDPQSQHGQLCKASGHSFYNISPFDFEKLLGDSKNIAKNLRAYINGFSENMRDVVDKFKLRTTIDTLEDKGLLFLMVKKFSETDLHPATVDNFTMGTIFEELVRRFNEQSNEEAGEHFTPRDEIRLMVKLLINGDKEMLKQKAVVRTIFDPACGTGGMLSVAKEYILKEINPQADIHLFGQEVNDETCAICKSDMLIKGEDKDAENIKADSSLSKDGHPSATFDYEISNPPYGKDWKKDEPFVKEEADRGLAGRFGAGLPRISDGQLLFLQHMLSKMKPVAEGGTRIAIVMNGSPLFTGDAGSGESEIRRWILENDWLEAIVALPSELFYNTGINTYVWVLSNRKAKKRAGKVLLINGAATVKEGDGKNAKESNVFARKMRKSLGNKRNELGEEHVTELARLAAAFAEGLHSKIFNTSDFGYRKVTVERPLRLNFQASAERMARLEAESGFSNLASSKRKGAAGEAEIAEGKKFQKTLVAVLKSLDGGKVFKNREKFTDVLDAAFKKAEVKLPAPAKKAVFSALSERDETAEVCVGPDGKPEADSELRDTENVPLHEDIEAYFAREVTPHVPDAWVNESVRDKKDGKVGVVGYEINFNRYFYQYEPPRPLEVIDREIKALEEEILAMLKDVTA